MHNTFITGEKVYFRCIDETDAEGQYLDWLNDREVTRLLDSGAFPNTIDKMEEYYYNVALSQSLAK
ncbi:hypothetical protein ACFLV3_00370 [Chloroflexota bacterium]